MRVLRFILRNMTDFAVSFALLCGICLNFIQFLLRN